MPFDMIGHNRLVAFTPPDRDISKQVIIQPWRRILNCLHQIPAKYLWDVIGNPKNNECCRDAENLSLEVRRTQQSVVDEYGREHDYPDLYVIKCDCQREHIRLLVAPGSIGKPPPVENLNPLFKENTNGQTNT